MKKVFILSLILILCTGCIKINNVDDYNTIIDNITSRSKKTNTASMGYKYYLPIGVSKIYDQEYNQKFNNDGVDIYLYVDIVSYYYQNSLNFDEDATNSYYYQKINNDKKTGYLKIIEQDKNNYFIKIVYNYAKIESYVPKIKLNSILTNSMIILDSIKYNDSLVEKIIDEEHYSSIDKEYQIKKPQDAKSKFNEYLSEYVQSEESGIPDLPED